MIKLISLLSNKKKIIKKILFTLVIIFIYFIGTQIFIPFHEKLEYNIYNKLNFNNKNNFFSLFDNSNSLTLLSLSVFPYVTASIIVQLGQKILPFLIEWQEQGEKGKYKINIVTRILTILIALGQSWTIIKRCLVYDPNYIFIDLFFLVVGVFICIWFADLITSKGLGNGISILIAIGISDKLYKTFSYLFDFQEHKDVLVIHLLIIFSFLCLLILTIILSLAYLKIPIHYAVDKKNDKIDNYIPFKLNTSGILPIILADTFLHIPSYIQLLFNDNAGINNFANAFYKSNSELGVYFFLYLLLILLFSFFASFRAINPKDVAEHLSKQNAYLKDVKPGAPTVKKITHEIFKLTCIGSLFLTLLAACPQIINYFVGHDISKNIEFGGTSFLIIVGVAIESIQNLKTNDDVKKQYNTFF
uniref:Protein translocase subunit SecY n=1 Tax=Ash yellows phytoplasma TaxID=35780 RepID=E3SFS9_ASHYP|nr:protein translocase [Candidatus Phytoplasma fraxini]